MATKEQIKNAVAKLQAEFNNPVVIRGIQRVMADFDRSSDVVNSIAAQQGTDVVTVAMIEEYCAFHGVSNQTRLDAIALVRR